MATTVASLVGAANAADLSVYTTASFTPQAGDFLIANIAASGTVINGTVTDTQNLGWSVIGSVNDGVNEIVMFMSQRTASAVSMTVSWDVTADPATGARLGILAIRGSDSAVRQFATGTGALGTTPSVTFAQAILTTNAVIGQVGNTTNPAAITQSVGWTEIADAGWTPPVTGFQIQRIHSGETSTTLNWASVSATAWLAMAVEFYDVGSATGQQPFNYIDGWYGVQI